MTPWLVLIHQLPPEPSYLRVKVARRLQRIGAVQIKNTVYVLPSTEQCAEDLQWAIREIREGGGEANLFESRFIDGITDADVEQRFKEERNADFDEIIKDARAPAPRLPQLRRRLAAVQAIDFFAAPRGPAASAFLDKLARGESAPVAADLLAADYRGRTWVTRAGVHVDRMASAWLIRRFIDKNARFRFVARALPPAPRALSFDMPHGDFTHDGDRCTFEVLRDRFGIDDRAVHAIGEIVHDIDLKDEKFGREETAGVAALVAGIALAHRTDKERLARAAEALDELYEWFRRKR